MNSGVLVGMDSRLCIPIVRRNIKPADGDVIRSQNLAVSALYQTATCIHSSVTAPVLGQSNGKY
jgi:hypothetical protein